MSAILVAIEGSDALTVKTTMSESGLAVTVSAAVTTARSRSARRATSSVNEGGCAARTCAATARVLRVLTDNAKVYRVGGCWSAVCTALGIRRRFTKPGRPWTNGKAERLNRTLLTEFAYNQPWTGNTQRLTALPAWVNAYNTERAHTALGGHPPISRLTAA